MHYSRSGPLLFVIIYSFISCETTRSKKLIEPNYELQNQSEYRYTYNLKGLKDSTYSDYFVYVDGRLAYINHTLTISKYNSSNKLILEQDYERDVEGMKLVGEKHLLYNNKHQLREETDISYGQMFMKRILEYNAFDSLAKMTTLIKQTAATLEEAAKADRKNVKYDTSVVQYVYNDKKQQISPEPGMDQSAETILLNDSIRIQIVKYSGGGFIDSTWYKRDSKIRSISIHQFEGTESKTVTYYNTQGDISKIISLKRIN
jgi:hypothetical protein